MDNGLLTVSVSPRELLGTYGVPRAAAVTGSALFAASTLRRSFSSPSFGGPASSSPSRARTPASAPGTRPARRAPGALSLAELRGIVLTRAGASPSASASQRSLDRTLNPYWPAYAADFSSPWDPVDDVDCVASRQSTQSRLGWCVSQPGDSRGSTAETRAGAAGVACPAPARPASEPAPKRASEPGGSLSVGARAQRSRPSATFADGPPPGVAEDAHGAPELREEDDGGGAAPERGQGRSALRAGGEGESSQRLRSFRHSTSSAPSYGVHRGRSKKYNPFAQMIQDPTHNVEMRKRWLTDDKGYLEARTEDLRRERRLNERFASGAAFPLDDGEGLPKVAARPLGQQRRRRPRREVAGPAGKAGRRPETQPCIKSLRGLQRDLGRSTQDVENASRSKGQTDRGTVFSVGVLGAVAVARKLSVNSGGSRE